jgi:hypothetical protein
MQHMQICELLQVIKSHRSGENLGGRFEAARLACYLFLTMFVQECYNMLYLVYRKSRFKSKKTKYGLNTLIYLARQYDRGSILIGRRSPEGSTKLLHLSA